MPQKIKYIKDKSGRKQGVMIAGDLPNGKIGIGFAQCNKMDKFDREKGFRIATGRAVVWAELTEIGNVPYKIAAELGDFVERCKKYFQGKELPVWADKLVGGDSI